MTHTHAGIAKTGECSLNNTAREVERLQQEVCMWKKPVTLFGLAAAFSGAVLCADKALAAEEAGSWKNFGQIKLGMLAPSSSMDDAEYDPGVVFSATYGRYLTSFLVIEGTVEMAASESEYHLYNSNAGHYKQENVLSSGAGLLTLKGVAATGPVNLYGGGGVGLYGVTLDSEIDSEYFGELDKDESDSVFGVHAVAGLICNATDRLFFGAEFMYRWTDDVDIRETVATVPVDYTGDLSGYQITMTAGFRF